MKNRTLAIASIIVLLSILPSSAQVPGHRNFVLPLKGGGSISISTVSEPTDQPNPFSSMGGVMHDGLIHRLIVNKSAGYYFGYDLIITRMPESRQFKIVVKPLDDSDQSGFSLESFKKRDIGRPEQKGITPAIPQSSAPQIVEDGATYAIDLLTNNKTGAKVFDVLKVSFDDLLPSDSPRRLPTRDFTLNDVELSVDNYRLLINGNLVATELSAGFTGPIIWFALPGKGRFIFSVAPREGYDFQKIAVADQNKLSFTIDGDQYLWSSTSPIVGNGGNWNVWVMRDLNFKANQESAGLPGLKRTPNRSAADTSAPQLDWGRANRMEDLFPKTKGTDKMSPTVSRPRP